MGRQSAGDIGFMKTGKTGKHRTQPRFELTGGAVCLDFVNTVDDRASGTPKELVPHYADLARFAEDTGVLTHSQAEDLSSRSLAEPGEANRVLKSAMALREAMYVIFWAAAHRQKIPPGALEALNAFVREAGRHSVLAQSNGHFVWKFDELTNPEPAFDAILWPIARSAADLLASDRLAFVRACSSKTCEWLFVDTSKNHRRRWCDMKLCGNRAKVRRFYAHQKKAV
jgi:predicted RNA-binding Zn ribbon-like protein